MNKVKIIPFKTQHVECMDVRDYETSTVFNLSNLETGLKVFEERRSAGTMVYDGRILGIVGYFELWPGVCELFVLPSKYLNEYPIPFARCIRRTINQEIFKSYHRIQIMALDDELHNNWLKFLKFEKEGHLKKYDSLGNNFNMWARVN